MVNFGDTRLPRRFWAKVLPVDGGCWIWTAYVSIVGYGQFGWNRTVEAAHRVAYRALVGDPAGFDVDHRCGNKRCVNPTHLEAVTHQENTHRAALLRRKPFCKRGHAMTDDNVITRQRSDGGPLRKCIECERARRQEDRRFRAEFFPRLRPLTAEQIDAVNAALESA